MDVRFQKPVSTRGVDVAGAVGAGNPPGDTVKLDTLMLSQSGNVASVLNDSGARRPLAPGFEGFFTEVKITGLSPSGTRFENSFPIDDKGFVQGGAGRALGHVPYQVTLVGKDGSTFSTTVDITPKKLKVSHQGYEALSGLELQRDKEPVPARASVKIDAMLLSQSGNVSPYLDANGARRPLVPDSAGEFVALKVIGLSPSGTRFENSFAIDDKGFLQGGAARPLGHVPYELRLVDKDGAEFKAVVDITPKAVGKSHQGYENISGLTFSRVDTDDGALGARSDDARQALRNFTAHGGGAARAGQGPWTSRLKDP